MLPAVTHCCAHTPTSQALCTNQDSDSCQKSTNSPWLRYSDKTKPSALSQCTRCSALSCPVKGNILHKTPKHSNKSTQNSVSPVAACFSCIVGSQTSTRQQSRLGSPAMKSLHYHWPAQAALAANMIHAQRYNQKRAPAQDCEINTITAELSWSHCGPADIYKGRHTHAGAVIHLEGPHHHPNSLTGDGMRITLKGARQRQKQLLQRPQSRGPGAPVWRSCLHSTCAPPAST